MARALSALVALALFASPAAALAKSPQTNAPPGNSAIDQYLETVPGATGSSPPKPPGAGSTSALTAAQRARLLRLGPDGKTLAAAVDATSPARAKTPSRLPPLAAEGRSPLPEVLGAAVGRDGGGGGGGMGVLLPAILLASLLAVITIVLLRRRSAS